MTMRNPLRRDYNRVMDEVGAFLDRQDFRGPPGMFRRRSTRPKREISRTIAERWILVAHTTAAPRQPGNLAFEIYDARAGQLVLKRTLGVHSEEEVATAFEDLAALLRRVPANVTNIQLAQAVDTRESAPVTPVVPRVLPVLVIQTRGNMRDEGVIRTALNEAGFSLSRMDERPGFRLELAVRSRTGQAVGQSEAQRAIAALQRQGFRVDSWAPVAAPLPAQPPGPPPLPAPRRAQRRFALEPRPMKAPWRR